MGRSFVIAAVSIMLTGCWTWEWKCPDDEGDGDPTTATIPVSVDWTRSGIAVTQDDPTGGELVHRVALMFYPRDGSPMFTQYMEGDIFQKEIRLGVGTYDIVVMNESVDDLNHWGGTITFSDADSFADFAATIDPMSDVDRQVIFPGYAGSEDIVTVPLALASGVIEGFVVTEEMAQTTRAATPLNVVMRPLTHEITVSLRVKNLTSAQPVHTAVKGFTDKVMMASAEPVQSPATHLVLLNKRTLDANGRDGVASRTFLSFGREPQPSSYGVEMAITLASGKPYEPDTPLVFDVTEQVMAGGEIDIAIPGEIELPVIEGGISIDEWDDDIIQLN